MTSAEAWKESLNYVSAGGYFETDAEETRGVPVRLFLTPSLLEELEDSVLPQGDGKGAKKAPFSMPDGTVATAEKLGWEHGELSCCRSTHGMH